MSEIFLNGLTNPPLTNTFLGAGEEPPDLDADLVAGAFGLNGGFLGWAGAREDCEACPLGCHCLSRGGAALSLQNPGCAP